MANRKRIKMYCSSITEISYVSKPETGRVAETGICLRDSAQGHTSFNTPEEVLADFLKTEGYEADKDTKLMWSENPIEGSNETALSIGFSKLLNEKGYRPLPGELMQWNVGELNLYEHYVSMIIYEFDCKILNKAFIKKIHLLDKFKN